MVKFAPCKSKTPYDCNGNLFEESQGTTVVRSFVWDADNKPVSIIRSGSTTTFAYSGDGARVQKVGTKTIRYVGGYEDHATDGVKVKRIAAGGLTLATKVVGGPNAGLYYAYGDHLGSLNVLTNSSGTEVQRLTYRPFGETHTNQGSKDFEKHRFTGQEEDPETGLYYYHARYYNPVLGRFISADPIVPSLGNPQTLNRYSYVENNPVNLIDPTGHAGFKKLLGGLITVAAVVGSIVAGMCGQVWAIPLIWAAAGAANAALNGGDSQAILNAAALGAASSLMGMAAYGSVSAAISTYAPSSIAVLGGAAAAGAASGPAAAAMGGAPVGRSVLMGAITAVAFALVAYAAVSQYNSAESPAANTSNLYADAGE
jgi:RHS repeat-associated protein